MIVVKSDRALFVDVDNTLIMWDKDGKWHPHKKHLDLLMRFHIRKQPIIIWSAGGYEWATRAVELLGIKDIVTAVMCKPAWWVDDLTANEVLAEKDRIYLQDDFEEIA